MIDEGLPFHCVQGRGFRRSRRAHNRGLHVPYLIVGLLLTLCGCQSPLFGVAGTASAAVSRQVKPQITVSPTTVHPGGRVTISGHGFGAGQIHVVWNGQTIGTIHAVGTGDEQISLVITLPSNAPLGQVSVALINVTDGAHAGAVLTVTATAPPSAGDGPVSTPVPTATAAAATPGIPRSGSTVNGCAITADQAAAERYVLIVLNRDRAAAGAQPLQLHPVLSRASREHSCEMLHRQKLQHASADGSTPFDRFTRYGIKFVVAGRTSAIPTAMDSRRPSTR